MRRREFITLLGGASVWPLVAHAQQRERMRRIGFLWSAFAADDPEGQARGSAFVQGLQESGWSVGRNLRIDNRWGLNQTDQLRRGAEELVMLAPDVLFGAGTAAAGALQQATRALPIVFANVLDPVGAGYVDSLAHPGGNTTGFMTIEYGQSGKWLELLKQIAPHVTRAGVFRSLTTPAGVSQLGAIQAVAPILGVEVIPITVRSDADLERAVSDFARGPNGGLITPYGFGATTRGVMALAARHRLPAVYNSRDYVVSGGLISYGPDIVDLYRRSAGYVDRVLKGEKPADLPVQVPTKYELVINLKTANTLGLTVPLSLRGRADEVIE